MAYSLEYDKKWVLPYLRNYEGLSRQGRLVLFTTLREYLGEHGDDFRTDEGLRRWRSPFVLRPIDVAQDDKPARDFHYPVLC